jgi:hypothetical protein
MTTRAQINAAINQAIKTEFPGIKIVSQDVEEGFDRPSFFVQLETTRTETFQGTIRRDMTCRIRYFPKNRYQYKEEAYDVIDRLESLFGLNFPVGDRTITIDGAFADIIDKVVHYDFDFSFYDEAGGDEPEGPTMQELIYNG